MGRKKEELYETECWVTLMVGLNKGTKLVLPDTMAYSEEETRNNYKRLYGGYFDKVSELDLKTGIIPTFRKAVLQIKI